MDEKSRGSPRLRFTKEETEAEAAVFEEPVAETMDAQTQFMKKKRKRMKTDKSAFISDSDSFITDDASKGKTDRKDIRKARQPDVSSSGESVISDELAFRQKAIPKVDAKKATQRKATRLYFEESKPKPASQLHHTVDAVDRFTDELHRQLQSANEDDNDAVNAVLRVEETTTGSLQNSEHAYHAHKLRQYRRTSQQSMKAEATQSASYTPHIPKEEPTAFSGNPLSRLQQRLAIRREYAAAKSAASSAAATAKGAERAVRDTSTVAKDVVTAVTEKPKGLSVLLIIGMLIVILFSVQSCTPLMEGILEALVIGTYPAEEADVLAAEQAYAALESALQDELLNYSAWHPEYDECYVNLDDIGHDPYVLIAIISACMNGEEWTIDTAMPIIRRYFALQYKISEDVTVETQFMTEIIDGEEYEIPYDYTICEVTLKSENLSHLPVYTMSEDQLSLYALYMATHGNMEGIFMGYPNATPLRDPTLYDIPQETLDADPEFARLMEEATKYIGYPYVWGGSNPNTSFDCAGFVCWAYSNSGVSNITGLGATGLYNTCREVSASEVKPGDLVFFEGTMGASVSGITHVGIYVGNNMMLHCGSPIGYADLTDSYWQQHFHSYGRVP